MLQEFEIQFLIWTNQIKVKYSINIFRPLEQWLFCQFLNNFSLFSNIKIPKYQFLTEKTMTIYKNTVISDVIWRSKVQLIFSVLVFFDGEWNCYFELLACIHPEINKKFGVHFSLKFNKKSVAVMSFDF